ncbi:MAG: thiol peroxidase [Arachnia sp.]
MTEITFRGTPVNTVGQLPEVGSAAPDFEVTGADLQPLTKSAFDGKVLVLNIFPSVDTGICAMSVRRFNEIAAGRDGVAVLCVSRDLPMALGRFCGAEGIENVTVASDFRTSFGETYGVTMADGPLAHLLSRAVVVIAADGSVAYTEQVPEIGQEPDYDAALAALG